MHSPMNYKLMLWTTLPLMAVSACTSNRSDPTLTIEEQLGAMQVTASTTGPNQDADGYIVAIDEGTNTPIGVNETVTFSQLVVRRYSVALLEVAGNCEVVGDNPRLVSLIVGATKDEEFVINCS